MSKAIDVHFISRWEEGEIVTPARLDLASGYVSVIEVSDDGTEYEHLIEECIQVILPDGKIGEFSVEQNEDNEYGVAADNLAQLRQALAGK